MALMQVDITEKGERNIEKFKKEWRTSKLSTVKRMVEEFKPNGDG